MNSGRHLEDILLRYLKGISTKITYLVLRHLNFAEKLLSLDKVCLRCLKDILKKMTSEQHLEHIFLRYLKAISS